MNPPAATPLPDRNCSSAGTASWKTDCRRAAAVAAFSAVLALAINYLSSHPAPLLVFDGPGALPEHAERIGTEALKELLAAQKSVLLLDVRREDAFQAGHAAGALPVPFDAFVAQYQHLNLDSRLQSADEAVLICESEDCLSADRVAHLLKELHYTNVRVLYGGWKAYLDGGFPVERGGPGAAQ